MVDNSPTKRNKTPEVHQFSIAAISANQVFNTAGIIGYSLSP